MTKIQAFLSSTIQLNLIWVLIIALICKPDTRYLFKLYPSTNA